MLTGQVGIVLGSDAFWPRAIKAVTRSRSFHTVTAVSETECIGAEPGGARLRPISDFGTVIWTRFDLSDNDREWISRQGRLFVNTPYNYLALLVIFANLTLRVPIPAGLLRFISTTRRMECAQMSDVLLSFAGGQRVFAGTQPGVVYPGMWEAEIIRRGWDRLPA